jgi:hypothetical protein
MYKVRDVSTINFCVAPEWDHVDETLEDDLEKLLRLRSVVEESVQAGTAAFPGP